MAHTLSDIIDIIERLIPPSLAEEWDNSGLQLGDPSWPVAKIWVALDPTLGVVEAACSQDVDLLITHHPLIFKSLKAIDFHTPLGAVLSVAIHHHLAIYSAHTNLDSVAGGLNDILAQRLGLVDLEPLTIDVRIGRVKYGGDPIVQSEPPPGIGRVGNLTRTMTLKSLARAVKAEMGLDFVKIAGDPNLPVNKAAVCTGSGSSLMSDFFASDAQAYISGDIRYHDARDVEAANRGVIDIGHFSSEHFMAQNLALRLDSIFSESGIEVTVQACEIETDPFITI